MRGAYAAALVDVLGETVDYFGAADPFDVKVAAAHWRLVIAEIAGCAALGRPRSLVVRGAQKSFLAHVLPDGYALILLLRRRAFVASSRALSACERTLGREAGWDQPAAKTAWFPVEVECDARRRPTTVRWGLRANRIAPTHQLEVLGAFGTARATVVSRGRRTRGDQGYRVRLDSGAEVTLVREPGNFWYADDELASER